MGKFPQPQRGPALGDCLVPSRMKPYLSSCPDSSIYRRSLICGYLGGLRGQVGIPSYSGSRLVFFWEFSAVGSHSLVAVQNVDMIDAFGLSISWPEDCTCAL